MTWVLVLLLVGGGRVTAPQQNHEACLQAVAMANLQSSVKVAYCEWRKP